jgi:DNA-binding XRE family transcriptional regulator
MIRHQWQLARYRRDLARIKAIRQRINMLVRELGVDDQGLLVSIDERVAHILQEISQYNANCIDINAVIDRLALLEDLPSLFISARLALGWTQEELARRSGCTRKQIGLFEREGYASVRLQTATKIVQAFTQACMAESKGSNSS